MSGYTLSDGVTVKNKLGATSHEALEELETEPVRQRLFEIEIGYGPEGQFDAEHLKAIHRHLFQDVYEWAGHTRDEPVVLSDGAVATEPTLRKIAGRPFAEGEEIPAALDDIATQLRDANYLRDLPREAFAERAADVMADLNAVHPFREGNGRTQRVFMEQLAEAAGHELDFTVVSQERMTQASIAVHEHDDPAMMRRMFEEISDPSRVSLLREGIDKLQTAFDREAERSGKEPQQWNDLYVATVNPKHETELVFAGVAGDQFMARTETQILFGKASDLPDPHPERGEAFTLKFDSSAQQDGDLSGDIGRAATNAAAGAAVILDGVADMAEKAIDTIADSFANLLGGGASAPEQNQPAPPPEPAPKIDRAAAFLKAEQDMRDDRKSGHQDREARKAQMEELKRQFGSDLTEEKGEEISQQRGRDQGGGQSL